MDSPHTMRGHNARMPHTMHGHTMLCVTMHGTHTMHRHLPRQSRRRGRQKSISPSRQLFSKVESAHILAFEGIHPLQHSGVVWTMHGRLWTRERDAGTGLGMRTQIKIKQSGVILPLCLIKIQPICAQCTDAYGLAMHDAYGLANGTRALITFSTVTKVNRGSTFALRRFLSRWAALSSGP